MNKKIKIGIIGAGKIVESIHLPALLNIPDITVEWIFDKDEKRSALLSNMYLIDVVSADRLDEKIFEIDICLIAIPYGVRDEYIRKCAALQKSVYVEKPFAKTQAEHQTYCDLFAPYNLAVGFQRRYYKYISDIEHIIRSNLFGKIKAIHFNQGYFQIKGGSGFIADARMSGGGVIIESAIHTLDQILQFTKASNIFVDEVKCLSKSGIDYDTKFTTTLNCEDVNIPVYSHISSVRNLDNGITIEFSNGIVRFQPSVNNVLYATAVNQKKIVELFLPDNEFGNSCSSINVAFVQFWKDFIKAINTRQPNLTNAVNSLLTTKWIEQIYQQVN